MKKRCLEYEEKFRKYIFSFDFETHKKICKNLNVRERRAYEKEQKYITTVMLNDLHDEFHSLRFEDETFQEFVERTKDDDKEICITL